MWPASWISVVGLVGFLGQVDGHAYLMAPIARNFWATSAFQTWCVLNPVHSGIANSFCVIRTEAVTEALHVEYQVCIIRVVRRRFYRDLELVYSTDTTMIHVEVSFQPLFIARKIGGVDTTVWHTPST